MELNNQTKEQLGISDIVMFVAKIGESQQVETLEYQEEPTFQILMQRLHPNVREVFLKELKYLNFAVAYPKAIRLTKDEDDILWDKEYIKNRLVGNGFKQYREVS